MKKGGRGPLGPPLNPPMSKSLEYSVHWITYTKERKGGKSPVIKLTLKVTFYTVTSF